MEKIKIVYENLTIFGAGWMGEMCKEYFEFEPWDPTAQYSKKCLFFMDFFSIHADTGNKPNEFFQWCLDRDYKIIYDNLSEMHRGPKGDNVLVMHHDNWWWYSESLWWPGVGLDQYRPQKTYTKLALMPLRRGRPHRDRLLLSMSKWLDECYWSYIDYDRYLPNDKIQEGHDVQRDFLPQWYDDTYFSVVAETTVDPMPYQDVLLSEKTMKPIAFFHPYLIYGHTGTLAKLKSIGFETFENLFDESYDEEPNQELRLKKIIDNVRNFERKEYDTLTWEKLHHNRNLFFNAELVRQRVRDEIIAPIIRFAEQ